MNVVPSRACSSASSRAHVHAKLRVEIGQRLVHQECRGLAHHRAAERHALPLAAGELRRPALEQRIDLQLPRDGVHFAFDLAP